MSQTTLATPSPPSICISKSKHPSPVTEPRCTRGSRPIPAWWHRTESFLREIREHKPHEFGRTLALLHRGAGLIMGTPDVQAKSTQTDTADQITHDLIDWIGAALPGVPVIARSLAVHEREDGVDVRLVGLSPKPPPRA